MKLYDFTLYDVCLDAYFCVNFPLVEFLEIFQKPPGGFGGPPGDVWEWHPFLGFEMNRLAARVTPLGDANPCVLVQRFSMDSVMVGYWARFICMIWMYKLMKSMIITMFVWIQVINGEASKWKVGRVGIGVELLIWFLEFNDNEVEIYGIIECICMKEINLFVIYVLDCLERDLGV